MKMKKLILLLGLVLLLAGCTAAPQPEATEPAGIVGAALSWAELSPESMLSLTHATEFSAQFYPGGYSLLSIGTDQQFFLVPEGKEIPADLPEELVVLEQPLDHIYLVSTAAMDLFRGLDALDCIRLSGTEADGWFIPEARAAMEAGQILYAGKYNAPDYERILAEGCDLAVENTMIFHSPEVKEQLEGLGIPVLVDRSSYEADPLGRMEWIKLYGVLLGREVEAAAFYDDLMDRLSPILEQESSGKTVGFFYITGSGMANIRKPTDYISQCIRLAGGSSPFEGMELGDSESATATANVQMESFYAAARDADVLIYNSSTTTELQTMDELLEISDLLSGCRAVQNGNVWCTGKNLYQESLGLGQLILDLNAILTSENPDSLELTYLHRLK